MYWETHYLIESSSVGDHVDRKQGAVLKNEDPEMDHLAIDEPSGVEYVDHNGTNEKDWEMEGAEEEDHDRAGDEGGDDDDDDDDDEEDADYFPVRDEGTWPSSFRMHSFVLMSCT